MVPRLARAQCSKVRLARGRESLGGQRMADTLILPLSSCGVLVLNGTKRLWNCRSSRSYRHPKDAMRVSPPPSPRAATDQHKNINEVGLGVVLK